MVIDTSALIAILGYEAEAARFAESIEADPVRLISAASLLESAIVIEARYGEAGGNKLDKLIEVAQIQIEPVTVEQIAAARIAFRSTAKADTRRL